MTNGTDHPAPGVRQRPFLIERMPAGFAVAHDDQLHGPSSSGYWMVRGKMNSTSEFWTAIIRLLITALIEAEP